MLNSLQSILNLIFPLITFPYVSRVLSVEGIGKYNFANSIISYFVLLASLGISTFAVREGAKLRNDRKSISKFASRVFTINLTSMIFSYTVLFITLIIVHDLHKYRVAILIFSIQIFFNTIGTDWIYTIFEEYGYITARNIMFKIISIILLFLFVRHSNDYLKYVSITVFASSGSYLLNFFHAKRYCDIKIDINFNWKDYLIPILIIFASTVAIQIYVSSDTTILGFFEGDYIVGIYGTSVKIYQMVSQILMSMLVVTIPRLAMLMGQNKLREYNRTLKQLVNIMLFIVLPGIVGLFMTSKEIVLILAGNKYIRSVTSLQILCLAIFGSTLSTIFNQCALIPAKREKKTLISSSVSAVLNVAINFILIPLYSEIGAALTTVLSQFVMMFLNYCFSRDITGFIFKSKEVWHNLGTIILGCSGIVITCFLCQYIPNYILQLFLKIFLSLIVYVVITLALKNTVAIDYFYLFKMKLIKG